MCINRKRKWKKYLSENSSIEVNVHYSSECMNDAEAIFIISSVYIGKYDQKPSANVKFSLSAHVTTEVLDGNVIL